MNPDEISKPELGSGDGDRRADGYMVNAILILIMLVGAGLIGWSILEETMDVLFKHSAFMVAKQSTEVPEWAPSELRNLKRLDDAMVLKVAGLALMTLGALGLIVSIVRRSRSR